MLHLDRIRLEDYLTGSTLRAHLCTLTLSLSFNNVVRLPQETINYGIIPYLLAFLLVSVILALPCALQQITVGQFQQDVVGAWRAVPFFKGLGYLKLLTSFLASVYVVIFISISFAYIVYGASGATPFPECKEFVMTTVNFTNNISVSNCFNKTIMSPVLDKPQYYSVVSLVALVIWMSLSYVLYYCMRYTKKVFYVFSPLILILSVLTLIFMLDTTTRVLHISEHWMELLEPNLWYSVTIQVLMSNYISTGYLITAGDIIYSETNAKCKRVKLFDHLFMLGLLGMAFIHFVTSLQLVVDDIYKGFPSSFRIQRIPGYKSALILVFTNVISGWFYSFYWHAVGEYENKDRHTFVILLTIYDAMQRPGLHVAWPCLSLLMIFISGVIAVVAFLYPIHDLTRRVQGRRKWIAVITLCVLGVLITLLVFAARIEVIDLLDKKVVPFLIVFTTVLEFAAVAYIYGVTLLSSDVEFLTNDTPSKSWKIGWYITPPLVSAIFVWWLYGIIMVDDWNKWIMLGSFLVCLIVFAVFALLSISQQIQYDWFSKTRSAFKAADWGPVDPISRYYWLARREEIQRGITSNGTRPSRYSRNVLGQLSGTPSLVQLSEVERKNLDWPHFELAYKRRANSDDYVYNEYRKKTVKLSVPNIKPCSVSLDKDFVVKDYK